MPEGLTYLASDSTIIETQGVKAGRVVYRGRVETASLAQSMRESLETAGWRLVGSTMSAQSGSTQLYDRGGMSLQVRIWEGGLFSWYTYVELAAIGMTAHKPAGVSPSEPLPKIVPVPGMTPVPSSGPAPSGTRPPSASADPASPSATIIR
jgi:hypothetical protein